MSHVYDDTARELEETIRAAGKGQRIPLMEHANRLVPKGYGWEVVHDSATDRYDVRVWKAVKPQLP